MSVLGRVGLVVCAVTVAVLPIPAAWVERAYSRGVYLAFQRLLTPVSNRTSFALLDAFIVLGSAAIIGTLIWTYRRKRHRGRVPALADAALQLAAIVAALYVAFVALWGLNYRRQPLVERLEFEAGRVSPQAVVGLWKQAAAAANALRKELPANAWPASDALVPMLQPSFLRVQSQLADVTPAAAGRPKRSMLTWFFERAGVDGMTNPFFLEVLLNRSLLPFERPAVLAHEWAHLAGYGSESEASFIGWLVCLQGPPPAVYSAHLSLLWQLVSELPQGERSGLVALLDPIVRKDLQAIAQRVSRTTPVVRNVSWRVYDQYLKANRVEQGVRSYDLALRLILGTNFNEGWVPRRR